MRESINTFYSKHYLKTILVNNNATTLKRERALSKEDELFNICYGDSIRVKEPRKSSCIPTIDLKHVFHKLMTSDFDLKLVEHEKK